MEYIKVVNKNNGKIIGDKIELANSFLSKLKGLLGRTNLNKGEGIVLVTCSSIHCIGMKFTIDVVFMDKDKKVIGIKENLVPGSRARVKGAKYVLEVREGSIREKKINIGDVLLF